MREVVHTHVIRFFDVRALTLGGEEEPSVLPTAMLPLADVDLATFLDRRPRGVLPAALACRMMGHLDGALAHVHSHGLGHRDVKQGNCLNFLAADVHGQCFGLALLLADFVMAQRVSGDTRWCLDAEQTEKTMTAFVCTFQNRPREVWGLTLDDHGVDQDFEETTLHGSSLDVWSFWAVV